MEAVAFMLGALAFLGGLTLCVRRVLAPGEEAQRPLVRREAQLEAPKGKPRRKAA
jgi:hypothetical protein